MKIQSCTEPEKKLNSWQLFPNLLCSVHFQIWLSKTLRSSLNMEKIIPPLPVIDSIGRLSTYYLYELKFTAVMTLHEYLQLLPMNPILPTASELTLKFQREQDSPAQSRQLQTTS